MTYKLIITGQFKKNVRLCKKRGLPLNDLLNVINILLKQGCLPPSYRPHKLSGNRENQWECHIRPDWLLVWEQHDDRLILVMVATGTHSDLFGK